MTWERVRSNVWRHAHGHLIGIGGISRCLLRANHYRMIWETIALFYGFFEGGDMHGRLMVAVLVFNLQLFRRSRHAPDCGNLWQQQFQFTASSQKLTLDCRSRRTDSYISIHSFFAEADSKHIQSFHFTSVTLYTYCTILSHNSTIACISFDFFYSKSLKKGANPPKFSCSLGIRTYMMKDNS